MADLLTVSSISVRYGRPTVLRDVSLRLAKGELVCVIGQNGAGKSTLVKAIAGAVSPFQGSIRFSGTELVGRSPEAIARLGISYVPEGRHAFADMTVDENLLIGGYANPHPRRIPTLIEDAFHYFPRLRERRHSLAGRLSGGEQQMLVIARALMTGADFVIVDEPSLGLAPKIVAQVYDVLDGLGRERGLTLLINEQSASRVLKYADRVYVLRGGMVRLEDGAEALRGSTRLNDAYFGFEQSAAEKVL